MATMTSSSRKLLTFLKLASNQQAMLYFLANPTTVNKIRLDAGIKGDSESKEFVFVRVRKSNRIKSSAQKRKFDNLKGLASPCKRKRKTSKKPTTSVNEDTTVNDKSSTDVDTEVRTPSAVAEPSVEVAVEGAAVGTPAVVDVPGTDAATEDTVVGTPSGHIESVSSEVMTDSLQSPSQSTPLRPWTPGSITDNSFCFPFFLSFPVADFLLLASLFMLRRDPVSTLDHPCCSAFVDESAGPPSSDSLGKRLTSCTLFVLASARSAGAASISTGVSRCIALLTGALLFGDNAL
jgi:hypothetical protein